jgi:hypothetical protein
MCPLQLEMVTNSIIDFQISSNGNNNSRARGYLWAFLLPHVIIVVASVCRCYVWTLLLHKGVKVLSFVLKFVVTTFFFMHLYKMMICLLLFFLSFYKQKTTTSLHSSLFFFCFCASVKDDNKVIENNSHLGHDVAQWCLNDVAHFIHYS